MSADRHQPPPPETKCGELHPMARWPYGLEVRCSEPKGHLPAQMHEAKVKWTNPS